MTDIVARLESVRERLSVLADQPIAEPAATADRIRLLVDELDQLIFEAKGARPAPDPGRRAGRKQPDVEKCPRCTLRSLHMVPDQTRPAQHGADGEETLWLCSSCGYETWRSDG